MLKIEIGEGISFEIEGFELHFVVGKGEFV
jgi:hypothetical protein